MARPKNHHNLASYHLCFILLSTVSLASVAASLCSIPSPEPKHVPIAGKEALALLKSFQLSAGYFVGGEEIHFDKEESDEWSYVPHSFSLLPHSVGRTDDSSGLLHVAATLSLSGGRTRLLRGGAGRRRRRQSYLGEHTVSFYLAGYYSTSGGELCMTGSGTYSEDDGSIHHLPDVVLKLRLPNRPSLSDPFVTGKLQGSGFEAISLVAYAEGDGYRYGGDRASLPCVPPWPSPSPSRGAFDAFGGTNFSCARLKEHLVSAFKLRHGGDDVQHASSSTPMALPWLRELNMHVDQMQCAADGGVRAYVVFSNMTKQMRGMLSRRPSFTMKDEAVVAEGRWDSARNMLCLKACRVVRSDSEPTSLTVRPEKCGIGMSFWFPGFWTIRDRSAVAGLLWNSSKVPGIINVADGSVSASSINVDVHRSNFSDVNYVYNYTIVEKAKNHYLTSDLSKCKKKTHKGSFIAAKGNYTYRDFEFRFYPAKAMSHGDGHAYPVSIDSVMVYGDRLAADESFYNHTPVITKDDELLKISYEIRQFLPPAGWVRPNTTSYSFSLEEHQIMAEGVYDPKTGVLCMIGCRELVNASTDTDCEVLITVQFASLDAVAQGHGKGAISSLRAKTDGLYFEKVDVNLYGMYTDEVSESISRMDMESVMLVVSATLPCVFTALQILHAKRNPEASAATSLTMLVVLAMGYVASLLVASETLFVSRRAQWLPFQSYMPYELNQAMLRAPTLIALLLQLRLLQLAWSSRKSSDQQQGKPGDTRSAAERRALWVCLPLYLAGGALTVIVNVVNARRAEDSLTVHAGPPPATLWQDLVSSAGLALDAFLLPQVAMNAFSAGAGVVRAVSPWFYVGGAVVRAMPHVYDVIRRQSYAPSLRPSYVYAGPQDDRFGLAWDVAVPCVTGLLVVVLFLQQRRGGAAFLPRSCKSGGYEMVSSI